MAEHQPVVEGAVLGDLRVHGRQLDALGQQPQLRARRAAPRLLRALDEVLDADADGAGVGVAVDARQRGEEVQLGRDEPAARSVGRHELGDLAVDLGVVRVTEPQLQLGAEQVAHGGAEVGPPGGAGDQVQAEGQAALGERLQLHLDLVEVGAQRAPAVDDEEHVAVPVVGLPVAAP